MSWQKEYNLETKKFVFSDTGDEFLACIGFLQPKDTQCLRFFRHAAGQELKAVLNKENYLGGIDDAMMEKISAQDLIEIIGRRDQFEKAHKTCTE